MFDVGFWEILLIGIVALVVVGPERLPEVARTVGKWVAKGRRFVAGVKSDLNSELESGDLHKILGAQKEQIQELKTMVDSTRKEIETSTRDVVGSAKESFDDIQRKAKQSSAETSSSKGMQATATAATGSAALSTSSSSSDPIESADAAPDDSPEITPTPSSSTDKGSEDPESTPDDPKTGSNA